MCPLDTDSLKNIESFDFCVKWGKKSKSSVIDFKLMFPEHEYEKTYWLLSMIKYLLHIEYILKAEIMVHKCDPLN